MTGSVVGSRYARALVDAVLSSRSSVRPPDAVTQLKAIEDLLASSTELRAILETPAVPDSRKKAVLERLAIRAGASPLIVNFLKVLVDHKRIGLLTSIRSAFELLLDEHLGYVRVEVSSAAPLDDQQRKQLEAELIQLSGKQVRMHATVDPELLGGVVARLGSTVYDGSIRGQLEAMRRQLTNVGQVGNLRGIDNPALRSER